MPRKSAKHERVDELEVILSERKEASDTRFLMDMPCEAVVTMLLLLSMRYFLAWVPGPYRITLKGQ
jgi:hypothetical protein